MCNLCIDEKTLICSSNPDITLNKRSEIMQKCRHKEPFYLDNFHGLRFPATVVEEEDPLLYLSYLFQLGGQEGRPVLNTVEEEEEEETDLSAEEVSEEEGFFAGVQEEEEMGGQREDGRSSIEDEGSSLTEGGRQEDEESPLVAGIVTRGSVKNLPNYKFFKL